MAELQVTVPRMQKTLDFYHEVIMENLFVVYSQQFPEKTRGDLIADILHPLRHQGASGDDLLKQAYDSDDVNTYQLLLIACAYWVQSGRAYHEKLEELAWSYAMDAMFYCGSAKYSDSFDRLLPILREKIGDYALSTNASKGGITRNNPFKKAAAKAIQLIKARGEQGETWDSYTAAARSVLPQVKDLIEDKKKRYTARDGGAKAIAGHLTKVLEIAPFILQKRGRPAKRDEELKTLTATLPPTSLI